MKLYITLLLTALTIRAAAKDTPANYPGGIDSVHAYLLRHSDNLALQLDMNQTETIEIKLSISATGKVTKAIVTKKFECDNCEQELITAAMAMKGWKAAIKNNTAIASVYVTSFEVEGYPTVMEVSEEDAPPMMEKVSDAAEDSFAEQRQIPETSTTEKADIVYEFPSELAEFPGGQKALGEFLGKNIRYPARAIDKNITGRVYLKFIIDEEGNVSDVKVQRGIDGCPECGQAGIDAVQKMPKWKPARDKGKAVKSYYTLPIKFEMTGNGGEPGYGVADSKGVYTYTKTSPEYAAGENELKTYLTRPGIFKGKKGSCKIRFIVEPTGDLSEFTMIDGVAGCEKCDKEALKIIEKMGHWKPAEHNGLPVRCYVTVTLWY